MTHLELINAVLVRLRENTIAFGSYNSNPFYTLIGALVNDAKHAVEDAWDWSQLRATDSVAVVQSDKVVTLPASIDQHYHIDSVLLDEKGTYLTRQTDAWLRDAYKNEAVTAVAEGVPTHYGFAEDSAAGEQQITLYPPADASYTLSIRRSKHQDALEAYTDRLLVPSLPVYTLATALASRERGEIGGTPTSELFVIAQNHLSDAIARDSSRFPEELYWLTEDMSYNTNVSNG